MLLARFIHYLGMSMWLGGWLVVMVLVLSEREKTSHVRATVLFLVARAFTSVIVPGAILTLGSGIVWSMALVNAGDMQSRVAPNGVLVMTAAGFIGGLLIVFSALPTAVKLKALAASTAATEMPPIVERLGRRLVAISLAAGVLAVVSLFASVLAP